MTRSFVPYYVSRTALFAAVSVLFFGLTWKALLLAGVLLAFSLAYLHSGWFAIDPTRRWFPVRRDERAREAQRRALIAAVILGPAAYALLSAFATGASAASASMAIAVAVLVYFGCQFFLLAKA